MIGAQGVPAFQPCLRVTPASCPRCQRDHSVACSLLLTHAFPVCLPQIKLFNYPVVVQHAPALVYPGHSSHVPNVRWAVDESYAISVGGRDRCTFQFRIDTDKPAQPTKVRTL